MLELLCSLADVNLLTCSEGAYFHLKRYQQGNVTSYALIQGRSRKKPDNYKNKLLGNTQVREEPVYLPVL